VGKAAPERLLSHVVRTRLGSSLNRKEGKIREEEREGEGKEIRGKQRSAAWDRIFFRRRKGHGWTRVVRCWGRRGGRGGLGKERVLCGGKKGTDGEVRNALEWNPNIFKKEQEISPLEGGMEGGEQGGRKVEMRTQLAP